jgi:photosystem II stability/assembly factor-like uncharacterized protein
MLLLTGCVSSNPAGPAGAQSLEAALATHVHGVGVNPGGRVIYLATHNGLYTVDGSTARRVGPQIDLMGFAVAGPGRLFASGHPSPETGLPDPAGLLESTDGGVSWRALSREGISDFHALAASINGVVGFDSSLVRSSDGKTWETVDAGFVPFALAISPSGQTVLGTTAEVVQRSADGGSTWAPTTSPTLLLVDFVDDTTAVGLTPEGQVQVSTDAGLTWAAEGRVQGEPEAVTAVREKDGSIRVVAVTSTGLHDSNIS